MFEKIVLRRSERGSLTLGDIAEAMLFYQNVHIIFDTGLLLKMVQLVEMDAVIDLLKRPNVTATFFYQDLATRTQTIGAIAHHDFVVFEHAGEHAPPPSQRVSPSAVLETVLVRQGHDRSKSRKFLRDFFKAVPVKEIAGNRYVPGGLLKSATDDVYNNEFLVRAVNEALAHIPGGVRQNDLAIEILKTHIGFHALSNIDFDSINERRRHGSPPIEPLEFSHILESILSARFDAGLAAYYGGDFRTTNMSSGIIGIRSLDLLRRTGINLDKVSEFQKIIDVDGRKISEVIDSGERTFDEFLKLHDHSNRFRQWVGKVHPDREIIQTYLSEIVKEDWIGSLPVKGIRYVFSAVAEIVWPSAGKVVSLADTFLLDKMLQGWRPNHFVKDRLIPFLDGDRKEDC